MSEIQPQIEHEFVQSAKNVINAVNGREEISAGDFTKGLAKPELIKDEDVAYEVGHASKPLIDKALEIAKTGKVVPNVEEVRHKTREENAENGTYVRPMEVETPDGKLHDIGEAQRLVLEANHLEEDTRNKLQGVDTTPTWEDAHSQAHKYSGLPTGRVNTAYDKLQGAEARRQNWVSRAEDSRQRIEDEKKAA
jgi:hypothetical protein